MKKKQDHLSNFLANPEFVRWVKSPDKELEIYWNNWIQGHPEAIPDLMKAKSVVLALQAKKMVPTADDKAALLHEIITSESEFERAMQLKRFMGNQIKSDSKSVWDRVGQWYKVAAILVAVLLASGLYQAYKYEPNGENPVEIPTVSWITKETLPGEKLMVKLSDGSSIWLNSGSVLRFPETFDSLSRRLEMTGEGYFEIARDPNRPMQIRAEELTTLVLGTSFTINTTDEKRQRISLISGNVKVKNSNSEKDISLVPGEQLDYDKTTNAFIIRKFNSEEILGWKDGILQLRNASFKETVRTLEKWYGVEIQVSGSPSRSWSLSSEFKNQNLEVVLDRMAYIETFNFTIDHKKVYIQFQAQ